MTSMMSAAAAQRRAQRPGTGASSPRVPDVDELAAAAPPAVMALADQPAGLIVNTATRWRQLVTLYNY